ncbi:hypothetical protein BKA61DRAFT_108300 [Leptodontidium sp. MPI-SDFR-AT-0119]|nr:hypothetical protein BKA61DRAFT_108300 [Leptodontidium sp. MPI-SDFR-AT-0119]
MLISSPTYLTLALLILPFLSARPVSKPEECESSLFLKPRHPDDDPSDPTSWNANYGPWGDPGYKEHYGSSSPPPPVVVITAPAPAPAPAPPPSPPPAAPQAPPNSGLIGWFTPSGPSSGAKPDPLVCTEVPKTVNGKGVCSVDGKPTACEGIWRKPSLRDLWICMPF